MMINEYTQQRGCDGPWKNSPFGRAENGVDSVHQARAQAHDFRAEQRAVQLRIFALDGAWAEPYVARANSKAAKAVERGGRRWS